MHPNTPSDLSRISHRVTELRLEHRDLDVAIQQLEAHGVADELVVKRMKKRKLQIKDQIARLESALIPDLDA